jgi:hypothetical protein
MVRTCGSCFILAFLRELDLEKNREIRSQILLPEDTRLTRAGIGGKLWITTMRTTVKQFYKIYGGP